MKSRSGFISNSSSSSFIYVCKSCQLNLPVLGVYDYEIFIDNTFGETEFGWGPKEIYDTGSKIIFSYLQAKYLSSPGYIEMLEDVIKEYYGVKEITWWLGNGIDEEGCYAYIDHQSIGDDNLEMFDSRDTLIQFIFGPDSYISLDNDNY